MTSSALSVASQLRTLCANPDNHAYIIQQGVLKGLVDLLTTNQPSTVVLACVEAMYYLSVTPANRPGMVSVPDLVNRVFIVATTTDTPACYNVALSVLTYLKEASKDLSSEQWAQLSVKRIFSSTVAASTPPSSPMNRSTSNFSTPYALKEKEKETPRRVSRTITVRLSSVLSDDQRRAVERAMLALRGIVSVYIPPKSGANEVILRAMNDKQEIYEVLSNLNIGIIITKIIDEADEINKSKENGPGYLSPPKPLSTPDGRSALASLSNSTVQARLDALRKGMKPAEASDAAPEKAKVTSFFGKIGKAAVGKFW